MRKEIERELGRLSETMGVKVLYAVESGSRAWGFASPDSDYDVRFIYVRRKEDYLRLDAPRDVIEWRLDQVLDINGWDLKKALVQFHRSNSVLFEWSNSPIVYDTTEAWKQIYGQAASLYFSCKSAMYHYYGTANKNYYEYLQEEMVKYKKYFYVLRPILACKWIEARKGPPPVLFDELVKHVLEEEMKPVVAELLAKKVTMSEGELAPRIGRLDEYIEKNLVYYKERIASMADDRKSEWESLEQAFLRIL